MVSLQNNHLKLQISPVMKLLASQFANTIRIGLVAVAHCAPDVVVVDLENAVRQLAHAHVAITRRLCGEHCCC